MDFLVPIFYLLTLENPNQVSDVDWSTIKSRYIRLPNPFGVKVRYFERIVNGEEAGPNTIPYQVGIVISTPDDTFFCGGSLISRRYVLTAAHCLDNADSVEIRLGAHDITQDEPSQVRVNAIGWTQHQNWDPDLIRNDIAVIEIPEVPLTDNIQLATLPTRSQAANNFVGNSARISGWGLDSDDATSISPGLRQVSVNVIGNFLCNIQFLGAIRRSNICTSGRGGRGACSGDSGGPLVVNNTQVGLVSFGLGLGCEIGWPTAFTRVSSYLDWIQQNTDVTIQP